jgi:hypothetical protein
MFHADRQTDIQRTLLKWISDLARLISLSYFHLLNPLNKVQDVTTIHKFFFQSGIILKTMVSVI